MKTYNSPQAAMRIWDPTWKHHHVPLWFCVKARAWLRKTRKEYPLGMPADVMNEIALFFCGLPDHYGSRVHESGQRTVVMQPYGRHEADAAALCKALGLRLISPPDAPSPWMPGKNGTQFFEFLPA